jgi:hypothetical protein
LSLSDGIRDTPSLYCTQIAVRDWPAPPSRRAEIPSLLEMQCDELFPAHEPEFRLRNMACHHLLGA